MFRSKETSYRLLQVFTAAAILPMGVIASTGGTAGAAVKVDATNYTATCTGFAGSVKFSKPETTLGTTTPSPATDALKGTLTGCTVGSGTGTPVTVTSGKLTGSLTNPSSYHKCGGSSGVPIAVTGSVTIKWKASPKLTAASTLITASTATLTLVAASDAVNFTIDGASATGPFEGSNSGASDAVSGSTGVGSGAGLLASCATKKGLKGLTLASPLTGNASNLGLSHRGLRRRVGGQGSRSGPRVAPTGRRAAVVGCFPLRVPKSSFSWAAPARTAPPAPSNRVWNSSAGYAEQWPMTGGASQPWPS